MVCVGNYKFSCYLYGRSFTLQTDHQPLTYLNSAKLTNPRLMRWALKLQPFRFRVEAIPGVDNVGSLQDPLIVSACISKESHFSIDNLGKEFASSLKFIQYALPLPLVRSEEGVSVHPPEIYF